MKYPYALGALVDKADTRDYLYRDVMRASPAPEMVDYEPTMLPASNQGVRSSCVAFASCAVKEFQEQTNLSEEFVYEQIRSPHGGAYPRDAFRLFATSGVCKESLMPYQNIDDIEDTPFDKKKNRRAIGEAKFHLATGYARLNSIEDILQSLSLNGPCLIGIDWLDGWFLPREMLGGYPLLRPRQGAVAGGHAVCVCGFSKTDRVLKIKNSWGKDWGKNGYALLLFDILDGYLNDAWSLFDKRHPLAKVTPL